jgi:hypothetical protein
MAWHLLLKGTSNFGATGATSACKSAVLLQTISAAVLLQDISAAFSACQAAKLLSVSAHTHTHLEGTRMKSAPAVIW